MMDPVRALDSIYKIVSAFYDAGYLYSAPEEEKEIASNVVKFNPGNGAREALIKMMPDLSKMDAPNPLKADMILANLWLVGFKVVPLEPKDEEQ